MSATKVKPMATRNKKRKKIVHVVGTGTIGEPLIGLLLKFKKEWGIDEVTFHKNRALVHDRAKVRQLMKQGARLCTDTKTFSKFYAIGLEPVFNRLEAIHRADVVIDCTPCGNKNKTAYYTTPDDKPRLFLAQGSEKGFGTPYARGINEEALTQDDKFVQIVSCNTHNIAVLLDTLRKSFGPIIGSDFVCIRRSNDISQNGGMSPSIDVSVHEDSKGGGCGLNDSHWGTHHAYDVSRLFKTIDVDMPAYSSALKINSQYMHCIRFRIDFDYNQAWQTLEPIVKAFKENRRVSLTHETCANKIFSFGRDYGHRGRILTQTVLSIPSLDVRGIVWPDQLKGWHKDNKYFTRLVGFCFTPQDGNSLTSSVAATLWHLHGRNWSVVDEKMNVLRPYLFQEV